MDSRAAERAQDSAFIQADSQYPIISFLSFLHVPAMAPRHWSTLRVETLDVFEPPYEPMHRARGEAKRTDGRDTEEKAKSTHDAFGFG